MQQAVHGFAIKAAVPEAWAATQAFRNVRTMYAGRTIGPGSVLYLFDSENQGGQGLIAKGRVITVEALPKRPNLTRQTPCVDVTVDMLAWAQRRLGRSQLKPFSDWSDGRPETELNFKLYRQATDKIVGLTSAACEFLDSLF
jgi:hypothetical protein